MVSGNEKIITRRNGYGTVRAGWRMAVTVVMSTTVDLVRATPAAIAATIAAASTEATAGASAGAIAANIAMAIDVAVTAVMLGALDLHFQIVSVKPRPSAGRPYISISLSTMSLFVSGKSGGISDTSTIAQY